MTLFCMKERLPPLQRAFKKQADELGSMKTSTNFDINVFKNRDDGRFQPIIVNSVHDVQKVALKRNTPRLQKKDIGYSANFTPLQQSKQDHLKKRARSLPGDTRHKMTCLETITSATSTNTTTYAIKHELCN